ncbi:MAG: SDR family oxidoreductase [Planctomycetota bacterium]|nr:SDR family oxidoreductase [Planctomycetota bacterium]
MALRGQTALVVGGGTGIGRSIAISLAKSGCRVAIAGRRMAKLQEVAAGFALEPRLITHECNAADRASVKRLFEWANRELGQIDILVNSAGTNIKNRSIAEMRPEQWDEIMDINVTAAYNCIHEVLPQMRQRRAGLIINISSVAGKRAAKMAGVAYCASKFALTALSTAVGLEEAQHNIRISTIYPGEVDTPILEQRPSAVTDEHRARMLQPDDVAAAVMMICQLPPRAHIPELVIKPIGQDYA